jgi:threonine aldolase
MRQIGLLTGCAAYALNHNFPQLPRVHALARKLEAGLRELGAQILSADTCMVCRTFPSSIAVLKKCDLDLLRPHSPGHRV